MYVYRVAPYMPDAELPVLPFVSFSEAIQVTRLPTISFDLIETQWNSLAYIAILMPYMVNENVYYFITKEKRPDTDDYFHLELDDEQRVKWHHCDFFAIPILRRFVGRLQQRLETRELLNTMIHNLSEDPTTPAYYEALLAKLEQVEPRGLDHILFRKIFEEVEDIVKTEKHFRPDAPGCQAAEQNFKGLLAQLDSE
jgi:hypothetical protein